MDDLNQIQTGVDVIRNAAADLPLTPGVYRMIDGRGEVLYVGKAKALKKRVSSYYSIGRLPIRLQRMVSQTRSMEFVHTNTEAEALLLEANYIKQLKPRFNILLRDDKSFPYILMRKDHEFPTAVKYRGAKQAQKGQYYGPFAGAGDVNRALQSLYKMFQIRNCSDNNFASRSRPCLQYHIKRCTAPCVGLVSAQEYGKQIDEARDFLDGKSDVLQARYEQEMISASEAMDYERAALFRDRLKALRNLLARQDVNFSKLGDVDVIALAVMAGKACVQVFFYRGGLNYGNRAYFPRYEGDEVQREELMNSFLVQFYLNKPVPPKILLSDDVSDIAALRTGLEDLAQRKVEISVPKRGERLAAIQFATMNAEASLKRRVAQTQSDLAALEGVGELLDMEEAPRRIEIYDNSHISGSLMVGGMVVAGRDGFDKKSYRKFNIKDASASDDYGMMREVMQRRFRKVTEGALSPGDPDWPDLLLIDGGKGQLSSVYSVLDEYGISDLLTVVAIAKGEDRNAGKEQFFIRNPNGEGVRHFTLPLNDSRLYYLQILRDEAHRYAVSSHQARRKKAISENRLDQVPGIGTQKRQALIRYFGSAKAVEEASVAQIEMVRGVSKKNAQDIYVFFHE